MNKTKKWFAKLKTYICKGQYKEARAFILSIFILLDMQDEIIRMPYSMIEREWELYFAYLKEKLIR
jgi:hypothetical protein